MKDCLIHLGFEKTGTTSIQESLFLNRDYLRANGIYFPIFEIGGRPLGRNVCHILQSVTKRYDQIDPFWKLERSPRDLRSFGVSFLDKIIGDFYKSDCSTLLISSDLLRGPYLPSLCDILLQDVGPVRGCVYLRSPLHRFRSQFQQGLRAGRLRDGDHFLLLRPQIVELQDCFPSALMLRKYVERSEQKNWNAVDDFWSAVLQVEPPPNALAPSLNEADPAEITVVFAQMVEVVNDWNRDQRNLFFGWCRRAIREMKLNDHEYTRFEFSKNVARKVIAATVSDNQWLEANFGLRWDGIESEEPVEAAGSIIPTAQYLRQEVKYSARTCLAMSQHLLEKIRSGVPRGVDAAAATKVVTSAIEVFSDRQGQ